MIARLLAVSFRRPVLLALLAIGTAVLGAFSYGGLPRDVFPNLAPPVFNIIVQNPAMAPEELETGVALPIESALGGVPGVRRVRSYTQAGVTQVIVEFEPEWNYYRARQLVGERLSQVTATLPPGTEAPLLSGVAARLNEIVELTLSAAPGTLDLISLRDLAEFEIRNRLLGVPGVAIVERLGGYLRQFQIQIDPERLRARGVHLKEVVRAAREASENAAGSFITQGSTELTVRPLGRTDDVARLRQTVVGLRGRVPITIGDVAEVLEAPAPRRGIGHSQHGEIVSLRVVKQFGVDTVKVSRDVVAAVEELRRGLPEGAQLAVTYDQGALVDRALTSVGKAVALGAGVVVLVLIFVLGSWRAAAIVALTLPLSVLMAGLAFDALGVGLNAMTLGGISIAVGLVADAAIIMVENVAHRTSGAGVTSETGLAAAREVGRSILFAVAIVVAVFVPLAALSGLEGQIYRPLALAVIASMLGALLLTLAVIPPIAAAWLRGRTDREVWFVRSVKRVYRPALAFSMRHALWVRIISLGVTAPAIFLATQLGSEFVPEIDEGALMLQTKAPAEASLDYVDRVNHRVEDILRKSPEVKDVVRRTGRSEETGDPMLHTNSDVLVVLHEGVDARALTKVLRKRLAKVRGLSVLFTTPLNMRIDEGLGGTPADLVVSVFGPDLAVLDDLAERITAIARTLPGLADVRGKTGASAPQLHATVNTEGALRYGVRAGEVADLIRVALAGEKVGEIWRGQRHYDLVVRLREEARSTASQIESLYVDVPGGGHVMLREVADVREGSGVATLRRERLSRRVMVEAKVAGRDLGGAARELETAVRAKVEVPAGYFLEVGGRIEAKARAERSLFFSIGIAVCLVILLLYLALGRFDEVVVILLTLPDAFVGGIVALWIAGESWNVSSLVGLIGLFGIAVQNGLVLIAQTKEVCRRGVDFEAALREASLGRVRPKLLTAGVAIAGLLPLALSTGGGTELERPLAIVMIGGLVTSTLFTLLALPTFYELVHRIETRRSRKRNSDEESMTRESSRRR
jgi:cobalt-zinc-cadmium resistance protein CzcA